MLEDEWGGVKEDWSDNFDDMESGFWEDHYSKAEPDYFSMEMEVLNPDYVEDVYEYHDCKQDHVSYDTSRQKKIVKWLATSRFTVTMGNNGEFYISGQRKGKLKDGRVFNVINWLYEEEIKSGQKILQYKLKYNRKEQRLYFLIK